MSTAPPAGEPDAAWSPPERVEEYRVIRPLGRGAMGQVHLAEDSLLHRLVALKFVEVPSASARVRFFAEVRALARLQHPNVVAVYRVGELAGRPFLVYEYVRGRSLDRIDKPVEPREALRIGVALARGLAAVHRRGILHRDIKPANAMISEEGEAKLIDFGVAHLSPDTAAPPIALPADARAMDRLPRGGDPDATVSLPRSTASVEGAVLAFAETQPEGPIARAGTPLYWAPEIWRGEPPTTRADVYALGALLHELCAGRAPHEDGPVATLRERVISTPAEALDHAAPGVEPGFAAIVDRCLDRDPAKRFASGEALREALEQLDARAVGGAVPEGNPYRGLLAFEAEHRGLFFGRGAEIRAILDRLRSHAFVLVAGDSGVGKSSLCRAGVVPALTEAGSRVSTVLLGRRPLAALSAALAPLLGVDEAALAQKLRTDPGAAARDLRAAGGGPPVLFVDQLEELCTLASEDEAAAAAELLGALADPSSGARVLGTARTDFLARLSALSGLGEVIVPALHLLQPLSPARLREAIVGPAAAKGFSFETEAMIDALVDSAARAGGGMPLLQFALAELWDGRDEAARTIPASALEAIGGVAGALARHADGVVQKLLPQPRVAARRVLSRLVTAEGTRIRRTEGELLGDGADPAVRAALDALVRGRLLVARESEADGESAYEIAHEALLGGWETLRRWLGEDAELSAIRQRLERAAAEWDRLERSADALWNDRRLAEAQRIDPGDLGAKERAFFAASRRAIRRRLLLRAASILGVPLLIVLVVAAVRLQAARALESDVARHVAAAESALGVARAKSAEQGLREQAAYRLFDARENAAAEAEWALALKLGAAADDAGARAGQELEIGLQLAPGRAAIRAALADALYARAILAERRRELSERDELIKRLAVYDDDGTRRRRWDAPAHVRIDSSPPGAQVSFERIEPREGRRIALAPTAVGVTPVAAWEAPQGSLVLILEAPGRARVRLPIVLGRDEPRTLSIELPPAAEVPAGFLYVPRGEFLCGEGGAEQVRRFFAREPLHRASTEAYLIARTETTFAEWITYLRSLPASERPRRAPKARDEGHAVELVEAADGSFTLLLRPVREEYAAPEGGRIHYPGRTRRADQDWSKLPVTAVSHADALDYAAWLDRSGRVPGARLCSELEWERAARGADDRPYPGGDRLDPDDADHDATYNWEPLAMGPDEVGSHPASESPFGVLDLAGNAWEWVALAPGSSRPVMRGGGWYHAALDALSINREPTDPTYRSAFTGLRICATPRGAAR